MLRLVDLIYLVQPRSDSPGNDIAFLTFQSFQPNMSALFRICFTNFVLLIFAESSFAGILRSELQTFLGQNTPGGHNEPFVPSPDHPVPGKIPYTPDQKTHYFDKYINGSENGYYRRSSCPAVNVLANRGYIHRSGRNITSEEIAQAARDVYNFGDDNVRIKNYDHKKSQKPCLLTNTDHYCAQALV